MTSRELLSAELRNRLVALRRDLHRHPELSFQERRTATRLHDELAQLNGVDVEFVADTGVVARIAGRSRSAPTVAIRGDIDALPIQEETGLEFASQNDGVMHACGHDVHATWAVGAAFALVEQPAEGDVVVVLQPGEETGKGAGKIIEAGVLDGVSLIFGAHVDRRFPLGQVVADPGPLAASADDFHIELEGSGGHAARPQETPDPIVAGSDLVNSLQMIVSSKLNPTTPAVVTVATFHAGTATNVIPKLATLSGTIRALDPETRETLIKEIEDTVRGIAKAHAVEGRVRFDMGPPPLLNEQRATKMARAAVTKVLGDGALVPLGFTNMAGEDFAEYVQRVPGCFMRIGAREPDGEMIPGHSPRFYAAEDSIFVGAAVLAECARVASAAPRDS